MINYNYMLIREGRPRRRSRSRSSSGSKDAFGRDKQAAVIGRRKEAEKKAKPVRPRVRRRMKFFFKVGPFEGDELEKHCRVSAKCYPTTIPALYTMTKEKFNSAFLVLLLVSRQTKSQLLMINKLVPIK